MYLLQITVELIGDFLETQYKYHAMRYHFPKILILYFPAFSLHP
jgi:hypothetical protein